MNNMNSITPFQLTWSKIREILIPSNLISWSHIHGECIRLVRFVVSPFAYNVPSELKRVVHLLGNQ